MSKNQAMQPPSIQSAREQAVNIAARAATDMTLSNEEGAAMWIEVYNTVFREVLNSLRPEAKIEGQIRQEIGLKIE